MRIFPIKRQYSKIKPMNGRTISEFLPTQAETMRLFIIKGIAKDPFNSALWKFDGNPNLEVARSLTLSQGFLKEITQTIALIDLTLPMAVSTTTKNTTSGPKSKLRFLVKKSSIGGLKPTDIVSKIEYTN